MRKLLALYAAAVFILIFPTYKCFSVSMGEPYDHVTRNEIIWQLLVPSSLFTLATVGLLILTFAVIQRGARLSYAAVLGIVTLLIGVVAAESVLGYLWDLRVHAGIN